MKDEILIIVYKKKKISKNFYSINMKGICVIYWYLVFFWLNLCGVDFVVFKGEGWVGKYGV